MNPETILGDALDLPRFARILDELGPEGRLDTVRHIPGALMARLYEAAQGFRPLELSALVPDEAPALTEVVHVGQNNLPAFDRFEKRFCKPAGDGPVRELYGYNRQPWSWFSGPGYFIVRASTDEPGALAIDYQDVPPTKPDGWPAIAPNRGFGPTIVFGSMVDVLRGLSAHVTIGRARRWGRLTGNYFVLCRT